MSDPIIIVSNDGHMSAPLATYKKYLETKYHSALDELDAGENETYKHMNKTLSAYAANSAADDGLGDPFGEERQRGGYDVAYRMAENDKQGITAEIIFEGTQWTTAPWFNIQNWPHSDELRAVGSMAYHRWMADCIIESEGRIFGILEPGPCLDMKATIRELEWWAANGFVGTQCPGNVADPRLPPIYDSYFDPYWSACTDLGLQLVTHGGWGAPQGAMMEFLKTVMPRMEGGRQGLLSEVIGEMDNTMTLDQGPRQVFSQLIMGGVFDRHPKLKFIPTESHTDWIPGTVAYLDQQYDAGNTPLQQLKKRPSEYWRSNGMAGVTFLRPCEVELRYETGVDQMLYGMDYPHAEGVWPNNIDWLRAALKGVSEDEARLILGENAIRVYGLDHEKLKGIAKRVGLMPETILGDHYVSEELIGHFHRRSGFLKPAAPFNEPLWGPIIDKDLRQLEHA